MDEPVQVAGGDVRGRASSLIRERQEALAGDIAAAISAEQDALDIASWRAFAELLLRLFAASVDAGSLDTQSSAMRELERYCPPVTTRQLLNAIHHAERAILDEIALDSRLGATSEPWPVVAHAVRRAALEILGAHAEQVAGRDVPVTARDPLTTLMASPVFDVAVTQEIERAIRHAHQLAVLLFDIDEMSLINRDYGFGVGDRLLERLGILARQFFRMHDWVARRGGDAIAVLLPETPVDQAAILAGRFREMVQQRLVLQDHKTNVTKIVTVSAAVVGTDRVQSDLEAQDVMAEAEAAMLRAKLNGRNRIERVALLPTAFTIFGAATLLGESPREITHLIRDGSLKATRRGRHYHIDRDLIEAYRKTSR